MNLREVKLMVVLLVAAAGGLVMGVVSMIMLCRIADILAR